jgi:histidine phosphotransferase ChpT
LPVCKCGKNPGAKEGFNTSGCNLGADCSCPVRFVPNIAGRYFANRALFWGSGVDLLNRILGDTRYMEQDRAVELILIELISSRICHDLVGPVGAVNAGAELMGEAGVADDEALALMRKSGLEAARRLQLFRLAFGRAGNSVDTKSMRDAVAQSFEAEGKVTLQWDEIGIDPAHGRLVLNMVMLAREALPFGGDIRVTRESEGRITVNAAGKRAAFRPDIENVMKNEVSPEELDPRTVHGFFLRNLAHRTGGALSVLQDDGNVALIYD